MLYFILVFLAFYVWHAMGICIGYHRLLSHRSLACNKAVEYFFVLGGFLAFEGSPIWWATMHRAHHRHSDTPLDPHSPLNGWFNAHIGWTMLKTYPAHIQPATQAKDLLKDPIYCFLEQDGDWTRAHTLNFALGFAYRGLLWACFGWQVALASLLAGFAVLQIPLMLNLFCHMPKLGYRTFATTDVSVNVWWVAILALGEGWHNNHHAAPGSAQTGLKWWEFDPSWLTLKLLKKVGLIQRLNQMDEEKLHAKLRREAEKAIRDALPPSEELAMVAAETSTASGGKSVSRVA